MEEPNGLETTNPTDPRSLDKIKAGEKYCELTLAVLFNIPSDFKDRDGRVSVTPKEGEGIYNFKKDYHNGHFTKYFICTETPTHTQEEHQEYKQAS